MDSTYIAESWLYSVLSNDAQLGTYIGGVFVDSVPADIALPQRYVYITNQSAEDVSYVNKVIGWGTLLYAVRVVEETEGYGSLRAPAARVHTLLHRQRGTTAAGQVLACYRERPFRLTERIADRQIRYLGGIFRLLVKE